MFLATSLYWRTSLGRATYKYSLFIRLGILPFWIRGDTGQYRSAPSGYTFLMRLRDRIFSQTQGLSSYTRQQKHRKEACIHTSVHRARSETTMRRSGAEQNALHCATAVIRVTCKISVQNSTGCLLISWETILLFVTHSVEFIYGTRLQSWISSRRKFQVRL